MECQISLYQHYGRMVHSSAETADLRHNIQSIYVLTGVLIYKMWGVPRSQLVNL